jgi:O-succinylhomoserine sulfhydrylase
VVGSKAITDEVFKFLRTAGPTLSPFNAWVILKGLETLRIRMEAQSASGARARALARGSSAVSRGCTTPGSNRTRSTRLRCDSRKSGGAIVSFEVTGGREQRGRWSMRPG